jgi:nucleotide-binding universal stress UspA family protein
LDDSAAARAALAWAARYCRRTASALRAVNVLHWPVGIASIGRPAEQVLFLPEREVSSDHRHAIRGIFRDVAPEVSWMLTFAEGDAGEVLVRLADDKDIELLVVGTREHVGVRRAVLGSISHYCLSHARCPVVAVPK